MSHKVHPKSYRLRRLADWGSRWFEKKNLPLSLEEDFKIREYLKKKIGKLGVEKVEIERFPGRITIIIFSARPGLIIGRGGGGVEELKKQLEKVINKEKSAQASAPSGKEIKIEIREIKNPWSSAVLVAQWMVQQIEKRMPFRRVLKQTIDKAMTSKEVQGIRVQVSGRLNGAEIARREWLKRGRMPRQTLRADIDYAHEEALCTYGIISVKVWLYKGEKFEE